MKNNSYKFWGAAGVLIVIVVLVFLWYLSGLEPNYPATDFSGPLDYESPTTPPPGTTN